METRIIRKYSPNEVLRNSFEKKNNFRFFPQIYSKTGFIFKKYEWKNFKKYDSAISFDTKEEAIEFLKNYNTEEIVF